MYQNMKKINICLHADIGLLGWAYKHICIQGQHTISLWHYIAICLYLYYVIGVQADNGLHGILFAGQNFKNLLCVDMDIYIQEYISRRIPREWRRNRKNIWKIGGLSYKYGIIGIYGYSRIRQSWSAPADSKLCFRLTKTERFNGYRRQTVCPKICSEVA